MRYPFWVARVSRVIGKSDTTAKRGGWQVVFRVTASGSRPTGGQIPYAKTRPDTENATSREVASLDPARVTGLRSRLRAAAMATAPVAGIPGCILFYVDGRFVGGNSCRAPALLWVRRRLIRRPVGSLALIQGAILVPFKFIFFSIACNEKRARIFCNLVGCASPQSRKT